MSGLLELAVARGVYTDHTAAAQAAHHLTHGFVITRGPHTHTAYEGRWAPYAIDGLTVDLEPSDDGWRILIAATSDRALAAPAVLALDPDQLRWLTTTSLPAAAALLERIDAEHEHRRSTLHWNCR